MCDLATKFSEKFFFCDFFGFLRSSFVSSWLIHCSSSVSFFSDSLWLRFRAKKLSNVRTRFRCDMLLRFSQTCEFWSSKANWRLGFVAAVNHLNGTLRKQNFTFTGSKGHGLWFVIGGFQSVSCVSVFQGSLLVIEGSEKCNCEGGFWTFEFACLWKAQ